MIIDESELAMMPVKDLWANYEEAMDAAVEAANLKQRDEALFYMAVAKVTLDLYFDSVERIIVLINLGEPDDGIL